MNRDHIQIDDEDEIDIKEIFRTLYRYRYMIVLLVILTTVVSAYIAYFKPSVYQASATVEVGLDKRGYGGSQDVLSLAMDSGAMNSDTEMDIIKSRFLSEKALQKVDFSHRYYTTRNYREVELYKESPFRVGMLKGYGISFDLYPVDGKHYRLVVQEAEDANKTRWSYDKTHLYGKEIVTKRFHLNVVKAKEPKAAQYRFVILDPENLGSMVQRGVGVAQKSKFSTILEISYEDNVPLRAQEFANALADAYIQQNIEKKTKEATRKLAFIDKQLKYITENLKSSAVKLEEFKKTSNTVSLSAKAENILRQMSEYETKLAQISMQQEILNKLYRQVRSGKNLESIAIMGMDSDKSGLDEIVKELQNAIIKKKVLRESYTEVHSEVSKLTKTITQLKKVLIETIKNLKESSREQKELLEKQIAKQQKLLNTLPADERMYGQLQRKFVVNEKIYSYLLEKRSETAIVKAATVSKNRVIDSALLPKAPIKPKRKLIVLVGMILGFILGVALAFLRNYLDDRINEEEDITKVTNVPRLGVIPHIKKDGEKVQVFLSPKSALAESFRNLRTNLQFMGREHSGAHVVAVTSTVGGEGKTTICINLGGIMSIADKKTVILNLDMRKPTLHKKFGLKNGKGMSTLLSGRTSLGEVIQATQYANLDVITSGPVPPNPSELIQSELMERVLEKLRDVYDVIILDTPPIGLVTDARTLMHFADTSLYVLRADYSKKEFLRSIEKLSREEISGLGILLNDVKLGKGSYGYGYGYGYGYYEEERK
jgi:capsular exopolysaccharide synthesis family protein